MVTTRSSTRSSTTRSKSRRSSKKGSSKSDEGTGVANNYVSGGIEENGPLFALAICGPFVTILLGYLTSTSFKETGVVPHLSTMLPLCYSDFSACATNVINAGVSTLYPLDLPAIQFILGSSSSSGSGGGGSTAHDIGASGHPGTTIDLKDSTTWPHKSKGQKNDAAWASSFGVQKAPQTLQQIYDEWHFGWRDGPPLGDLERLYPQGLWRKGKQRDAVSQQVRSRRTIMEYLQDATDVEPLQNELYAHFDAVTDEQKKQVRRWPKIKSFLNENLRKRKDGYLDRSQEMSKRRKKKSTSTP